MMRFILQLLVQLEKVAATKVEELSRSARMCYDALETQPGAQYGEGTWWQAFNSVTYVTDHLQGRSAEQRLTISGSDITNHVRCKPQKRQSSMRSLPKIFCKLRKKYKTWLKKKDAGVPKYLHGLRKDKRNGK